MQTPINRRRVDIVVATIVMGATASIVPAPTATAAEMPRKPRIHYGPSTAQTCRGLQCKREWAKKVATSGSRIKLQLGEKSRVGVAI
ncbi:hypothetical protein ACWD4N_47970 [Streptomyces sp. NPDC002586]